MNFLNPGYDNIMAMLELLFHFIIVFLLSLLPKDLAGIVLVETACDPGLRIVAPNLLCQVMGCQQSDSVRRYK